MIVVTDAHVSMANGNTEHFFQMLSVLEGSSEDIVFLGDIFDLWISLPGYEEPIQKRFLDWCRRERAHRSIGFVEGNHEFYVCHRHADCFSWSSRRGHRIGNTLFVHGDLINRADKNYLRWRALSKNAVFRTVVRILPFGPRIAAKVKAGMKKTNAAFRIGLPKPALNAYADQTLGAEVRHILVGHFHEPYRYNGPINGFLEVLPDWFATEQITLFDPVRGTTESLHWREFSARQDPNHRKSSNPS